VRQGYPAKIEEEIDGKAVDIGITWEERRVAAEIIVCGIEKELFNLGKDLERGWDRVVFCAVDQKTLDQLRQRISEERGEDVLGSGKVTFRRLRWFLEHR
jgi:hypothetical protein